VGWLARHVGLLLLLLSSRHWIVRDIVWRTRLALVGVGCVQLDLGSLVKMSRDETQARLRSHNGGVRPSQCGEVDNPIVIGDYERARYDPLDRPWLNILVYSETDRGVNVKGKCLNSNGRQIGHGESQHRQVGPRQVNCRLKGRLEPCMLTATKTQTRHS